MERNSRKGTDDVMPRRPVQAASTVQVKDMIYLCLSHWMWFVLSLLITMGLAVFYLKKTPNVYTRTISILIKSDDKRDGSEEVLKDLGVFQESLNVTNEILSLKSSAVALEIVRRLNLDVSYMRDGAFHKEVAYGVNLPVTVRFEDLNDNETAGLLLSLSADGTVELSNMVRNGQAVDGVVSLKLGDTVSVSKMGRITVEPSPYFRNGMTDNIEVSHSGLQSVAASVGSRISAALRDKNSTIIDVNYRDQSIARAEDILNTLVAVYNEEWVKNRNLRMVSTSEFIRERLAVIEQELGNVEQDISDYKSEHLIPDVQQVGSMAMAQMNSAELQSHDLNDQLYMIRYIRNYLVDDRHDNQLLPSTSSFSNSNITGQINEYNNIMLQRNNHLANSSLQNPLVIDLNQHLATLRRSIIQSLDNEQTMLEAQLRSVRSSRNNAVSKIASNPEQSKYLLSVERQQKVKESLYLYLLQKREENELSQTFTAYNSQLIEPPHGSMTPTEPVKKTILLFAFLAGLIVPGGILFMREWMDTSVRGRKDLESIKVPFVGEIPQAGKEKKRKQGKDQAKELPQVLVKEKSRNVMNEAFRVVRTNLEFILGFEAEHRVIMQTSMNPGSGKTFITVNLATALGIKNKKVLAIDLDMRKGSLSEYVGKPHHGVSNYLSGQEADFRHLIVKLNEIDVLPCGTLPPNPTELLFTQRFKHMMDAVRQDYDYVFIDCPPVEIVADAAIINRYVDMTLFVVRAQLLDRSLLPDIERWYDDKKYKNLSILLNGTQSAFNRYGYHKYGYRYGYHYGQYGYGENK